MNKYFAYICAFLFTAVVTGSCADEENVAPTADRSGITSLKAYFTSGPNIDKLAIDWAIPNNASVTDYVIPVPYYYPEESDETTAEYMKSMKLVATLENNCTINPALSVLDLNQKNTFTYTDPYGNKKDITISGKMTRSNKCALKAFFLTSNELTGIIDEDNKTVSIMTGEDLSQATAEVTLSAHATISPDPSIPHDMNNGIQFTVTADNGTDKAVYQVNRFIPPKLQNGYRKGSETLLFEKDMTTLGVTDANAIHPTLACIGRHVILNLGDGSAPQYFKKATGTKLGTIYIGDAIPTGAITSDNNGNMLICNYAGSGSVLNIYKTNSVTVKPTLLISYNNQLGVGMGSRLHVQGDLAKDAIITATIDNSTNCIRWIVSNGVVGSPENILFSGVNAWGGQDSNAKVVARSANMADGCFFDYYNGGADKLYFANAWTNPIGLMANTSGSAWGFNDGAIDTREFNNAKYFTLFEIGYWPSWGLPGHVYLYDASNPSSLSGDVASSGALKYSYKVADLYGTVGFAGDGRFGDVLMTPSEDGYFLYIFYASNTHLSFGGLQIDCIDK